MDLKNKMIKKIDFIGYILVYWCFVLNRAVLELVHSDLVTVFTGGLCLILILIYGKIRSINKVDLFVWMCLNLLLCILMFKTKLSYNYTSFFSINVFFLYTYLLVKIINNKNKLYHYIVNVAVFLSIASLVGFILELSGFSILYRWLPHLMVGGDKPVYWGTRGGFLYLFSSPKHQFRNCGIYGEPGMYQVALSIALYIQLFFLGIKNKKDRIKTITLVITQITALSTVGLLCLSIILCGYFIKIKKYNYVIPLILLIIILNIIPGPVKTYFADKLSIEDGQFEHGSPRTRWADTLTDLSLINESNILLGMGYDDYQEAYKLSPIQYRQYGASSNCLTKTLVVYGGIITVFILFLYGYNFHKRCDGVLAYFVFISVFLLSIISQEVIFKPLFLLFLVPDEEIFLYSENNIEKRRYLEN